MYQIPIDPTAVQGRRIGAWLIDFVFAGVIFIIAVNVFIDGISGLPGNLCAEDGRPPSETESPICTTDRLGTDGYIIYDENTDESIFIEAAGVWAPFALFGLYGIVSFVLVEGFAGGSIGKLIVGLRVVTVEGRKAGPGRAAVRFLLWIVDAFPYCFPLVGLITGLTTKGHRRLGDMAAGTFVVARAHVGQPVAIPGLSAPPAMAYAPPASTMPSAYPQAPTGWGPPPGAGPWSAPEQPSPWGAPAADPGHAASGSVPGNDLSVSGDDAGTQPQWDADRNTYIQWDVHRNAWLAWDTEQNEWKPIE